MQNKSTRGAVSVFLVLILVPCLLVTSIFVDLGRVNLSQSLASSSADLALNALLTQYDADLLEWYGMAASCQSVEEFYEGSAAFFLRMLSSQGLSKEEIQLVSNYYASITEDETIYDLLQVRPNESSTVTVSAVSGADLTNATMIKDQVVEFMKYRAPIELTLGLIDRITKDTSLSYAAENDENKALTDAKTNYFTAEGDLLQAAYATYSVLYYYGTPSTDALTNEELLGYAEKMNAARELYSQLHQTAVERYLNTSGLSTYERVQISLSRYRYDASDICSDKETGEDGETLYYIDENEIENLIEDMEKKITRFRSAINNFTANIGNLLNVTDGTGTNQANPVQWWVQMNKAISGKTSSLKTAAQNMLKAYAKVLAIDTCEMDLETLMAWNWDTLDEDGDLISPSLSSEAQELINTVKTLHSSYLSGGSSKNTYLKVVSRLETVSKAQASNISPANWSVTWNGQSRKATDALAAVSSELSSARDRLQNKLTLIECALYGGEFQGTRVEKIDTLMDLARTYRSKLDAWSTTANLTDTDLGESDRANIAGTAVDENGLPSKDNISTEARKIDSALIEALKTRLLNIRSQIKSVISAIDSLKYGGKKITEITSADTFLSQAKSKVNTSSIPLKNGELRSFAQSSFSTAFSPSTSPVFTLAHASDSAYNVRIDPMNPSNVATPEFLTYMFSKYKIPEVSQVQEEQKKINDGKGSGDSKKNEAQNKGRFHGSSTSIANDFSDTTKVSLLGGAFGSISELFTSLIELDVTSIRDDLYTTAYIMNMFSYATFEEEGIYQLMKEEDEANGTSKVTELTLPSGGGHRPTEYQNYLDAWKSTELTASYNKSLTNHMIHAANNAAYGAEVEYILMGAEGGSNADNVKKVYNNIYGIRYALNVVSGFMNFWSAGKNVTASAIQMVAGSIYVLSAGIIPVPLTKVILIPILTIFETAVDLNRLEAGFPVEIFKTTDDDWWVALQSSGSASDVSSFIKSLGNFEKTNSDQGIFYSDYLMAFVYVGLNSSGATGMYQRMAEVIQANIRKLSGDGSYHMSRARLYFKLEAELRVRPLMIALPLFQGEADEMTNNLDWCTYRISTVRGYS